MHGIPDTLAVKLVEEASNPIESWLAIIGGIAALVTVLLAIWQAYESLRQRKTEFRWKKAELAREIVDHILGDRYSGDALHMVDEMGETFEVEKGVFETIDYQEILGALGNPKESGSPKDRYIRRCFEALFYHFDRIEHFIQTDLLIFDDVKTPIDYYAYVLVKNKALYSSYINYVEFHNAGIFLERFPQWKKG